MHSGKVVLPRCGEVARGLRVDVRFLMLKTGLFFQSPVKGSMSSET